MQHRSQGPFASYSSRALLPFCRVLCTSHQQGSSGLETPARYDRWVRAADPPCLQHGDNPDLRIALCGYDEHDELAAHCWTQYRCWEANNGYCTQASRQTRAKENAKRERIWFSPHCLSPLLGLFLTMTHMPPWTVLTLALATVMLKWWRAPRR
jgi:hypothetical protein